MRRKIVFVKVESSIIDLDVVTLLVL